jgi:amidase
MSSSDADASVNTLAAQSQRKCTGYRLRISQRADKRPASDELPSLLNITLEQVAEGLDSKRFTSVDLVKAYIARIEECNEEFRAVLQINPDAVHVAKLLDQERGRSGRRG